MKLFGVHVKAPGIKWTSYSPIITGSGSNPTLGTTGVTNAKWRRNGGNMDISYSYYQTNAGSAGSGTYAIPIPSIGVVIDTTVHTLNPLSAPGTFSINNGNSPYANGHAHILSNTTIGAEVSGNTYGENTWGSSSFWNFASATFYIEMFISVPIVGWSENDILRISDDTKV